MDNGKPKDLKNPSGPIVTKNGYKVWVDRDLCIGAATCAAIASKAFRLDAEAKAIILETVDDENYETILDAAKSCPTVAIIIEDAEGNRVWPK